MSVASTDIKKLAVDTIRTLSMDAVQTANSGHPGTPMALAPVAYQLFNHAMKYDPAQPNWPGRDRFVLSCGHASMLLYSVLHLTGVKATDEAGQTTNELSIKLEDIEKFRQIGSPCAGHPEFGEAAGIETTTGPLGAGVSNAVGMSMAQKWLADNYNTEQHQLFDYDVYAVCSDGDLMEGVACEAASLAGHLKLDNLCWLYDDNHITIEGDTDLAFSENVGERFEGLGWNVVKVDDANDLAALAAGIDNFKACSDKPTLIIVKSIIGFGAPNKQDTHGSSRRPTRDGTKSLWPRKAMGFLPTKSSMYQKAFENTSDANIGQRGAESYAAWTEVSGQPIKRLTQKKTQELQSLFDGELPEGWDADIPTFEASEKGDATRNSSGKVLNAIAGEHPLHDWRFRRLGPQQQVKFDIRGCRRFSAGALRWTQPALRYS